MLQHEVLALDRAGAPSRWISVEAAACYYAKELVACDLGQHTFVLRGGINARTRRRSVLQVNSIIVVRGERVLPAKHRRDVRIERELLFKRDRYVCAYCGEQFAKRKRDLSMDHIVPTTQGGPHTWLNLVTACKPCNQHKDDRTPEQAAMPLLFAPYRPSRWEAFVLSGRNILADQMDLLLAHVPKGSRLHA